MVWNMKALIEFVDEKQGQPQGMSVSAVLTSLMWKLNIARYHAEESKQAINKLFGNPKDVGIVEVVDLIFEQTSGSERGKAFSNMQFVSEANLIACAQSLHSMADIFGQVVYFCLDLNNVLPKPITQRKQSLSVINKTMKENAIAPSITKLIEVFLKSQEFRYLTDYVNVTKHRSLIPARYTVSFVQEAQHGLQISRFSYEGRNYDVKWSDDFLNQDVITVQKMIIEIGCEINKYFVIN